MSSSTKEGIHVVGMNRILSKLRQWYHLALVLLIVALVGMGHTSVTAETPVAGGKTRTMPHVAITLGNRTINAVVANTPSTLRDGLLGWKTLPEDKGMLLDFGLEREYAIHMQGMKFPIDALWIDSSGEIRLIYQDIQPNSGKVYHSMFPCTYCLEISAGFCKKHGIEIGGKIRFGTSEK